MKIRNSRAMKKILYILLFMAFCSIDTFAQQCITDASGTWTTGYGWDWTDKSANNWKYYSGSNFSFNPLAKAMMIGCLPLSK